MTDKHTGGHTVGEWIATRDDFDDALHITTVERLSARFIPIAVITTGYDGPIESEQQANARLMAAAPDLLEAAKGALLELIGASAMIALEQNGWRWPDDAPDRVSFAVHNLVAAIAKATGASQ